MKFSDSDEYKGDLKEFKDLMIRRVDKRKINVLLGKELRRQNWRR